MSRIEMEMWEPVEDMKGKVRYAGQRRAVDVFKDLKAILDFNLRSDYNDK